MFYLWFFFQLHNSALNYWPLSFMIDSLFFMWSYTKYELVKLTWFFFAFFFLFIFALFLLFFFKSSFFILISNCGWRIGQINSSFFPSTLIFLNFFFVSFFDIWLLVLELCDFFAFLEWLSLFYIMGAC